MLRLRTTFRKEVPIEQFAHFAKMSGWEPHQHRGNADGHPEEYVWLTQNDVGVHWIADPVIGRNCIVVLGNDSQPVLDRIRDNFDCLSKAEAFTMIASSQNALETIIGLSILAATAPPSYDRECLITIESSLNHKDEDVRHMAALCIFYMPWSEFAPPLSRLLITENSELVRSVATQALHAVSEHS